MDKSKVEARIEVEYKYHAGDVTKRDFHQRIERFLNAVIEPLYVISLDDYFVNDIIDGKSFLRYRRGGGLNELTLKFKKDDSNNYIRKEINLNVDKNNNSSIVEFISLSGYRKLFSVFKEAWIWRIGDCDISYYTLPDGTSFIELEAECEVATEGIKKINHWEQALNLEGLEKEDRSLFEIFSGQMLDAHK